MNKTLLTLAILAGFLFPASNTEAQISMVTDPDDSNIQWIIVDGTDDDDSVEVLETFYGTSISLYDAGNNLVDSMHIRSNPFLNRRPTLGSPKQTIVLTYLRGGDDFYFNNSPHIDADLTSCGTGNDTVYAGPGESWVSSDYNDTGRKEIYGGDGDDWLVGGAGDDLIEGGNGADHIDGNNGDDELYGDAGNDVIDGGRGFNMLFGGTGKDEFLSAGQSVIHDE